MMANGADLNLIPTYLGVFMWAQEFSWLHTLGDFLICLSFFLISYAFIYFLRHRKDVKFRWFFLAFSVFTNSCAATHLLAVIEVWYPLSWEEGVMKGITGIISVLTSVLLIYLLPKVIALPSPSTLRVANAELSHENRIRREVEQQLRSLQSDLESRVEDRTRALALANWELAKRNMEIIEAQARIAEQANLIDLANDTIIVSNLNDEVEFWNKRAEVLHGISLAEAQGRKITELIYSDSGPFHLAKERLTKEGYWSGELLQRSSSGKTLVMDCRWTLLRTPIGEAKAVLSISTDITEHKKLEHQFLRSQRLESLGVLASGVAHDLNNILAPIMMGASMLKQELSEETKDVFIETIAESAERGANIVKQVLTFARGVSGESVPLQPKHLIREMKKVIRETFPKSISVVDELPDDLWVLKGDSTQLNQVLLNLCINASEAMPGGGEIILKAENVTLEPSDLPQLSKVKPGPYVLLKVSDSGKGIDPEIIDLIFDPFFTTKGVGKGSGLGLSTVIGIVKGHNGFVTVDSEPDKGTSFKVYLPACLDVGDPVIHMAEPGPVPKGHGETILVVDDEAGIRMVARTVLQANGYRVFTAGDGKQGLAVFEGQEGLVDLILTDVMMPNMDGVEMARAARSLYPGIKIIASTGQTEESRQAELNNLGVSSFLKKPYKAELLLRAVHSALYDRPVSSHSRDGVATAHV
jgi:PAS domain S-box-containing protein